MYDSIVNGCGHFTSLGGSRLHPKALEAMAGISNKFIDLNSLLVNAGNRIKDLCNAPPGYTGHVTTGASAGLALAVAACLCRDDLKIAEHLPNTAKCGGRTKIIVDAGSDTRWYQSMQLTGCELVELGAKGKPMTEDELAAAIDGNTAGIVCFAGGAPGILPLDAVVRIARAKGIPVVVDAAARLPPLSNLHYFCDVGVDCCLFSGGKMISGPQSSGFMLGKEAFIAAARVNACPNETAVGRPMKTCKESIVGLVAALEQFVIEAKTFPAGVNQLSSQLASLLKASPLSGTYLDVTVKSGASMGMFDVQPNAHDLVLIDLKNIEYSKMVLSLSFTLHHPIRLGLFSTLYVLFSPDNSPPLCPLLPPNL
jgi:L-seryl-tRNA(Ser) seleniumtransferase